MKKIAISICSFVLLMGAGCSDSFFDINDNPNLPTEESVTPQRLLPMVLNATAKKMAINYDFAAHWMGYWARGNDFGPSVPLENYNLTNDYQRTQWVNGNTTVVNPDIGWYDILKDAKIMENKGRETGQQFYVAAGKVIQSIGFMYLVDMYNNVPYSQALDLQNYIAPTYDEGQDIYNDLLRQLDTARTIFSSAEEVSIEDQEADILFGGDLTMWRKLANTQTLKLLIHQSEVLGGIPTEEIGKVTADGSGFLMAGETAEVQPGYATNAYQLNPMWGTFYRDHNNALIDNFNRANNHLLDKFRDNNDIRYQYVFLEAIDPKDGKLYDGNYLGHQPETDYGSSNESIVVGPGIVAEPDEPLWLFTSIESLFLQAEAAQRGWLSGVSSQTAYEDAVRESFSWLGVPNAATVANIYLEQQEIANWAANTDKIELIINQKYLALPSINNFEAWVDYRRLGFPTDVPLSLNSSTDGRKIPLRLLYPQEEYSYNAANVEAQGTINPQTSRIFWDKD